MEHIKLEGANVKTEQEEVGGKKQKRNSRWKYSIQMEARNISRVLTDNIQEMEIIGPEVTEKEATLA